MKEIEVPDSQEPTNIKEIRKFEEVIGNKLPQDYIEYLLMHNGGRPIEDECLLIEEIDDVDHVIDQIAIEYLYALYDGEEDHLIKEYHNYINRIPNELIPIGHDGVGNQICLCIKGKNYGKVYFWEESFEANPELGEIQPYYDNIYLVANNFTEFINKLF